MDNKLLSRHFKLLGQLHELYEADPFKVKALASVAMRIDKNAVRLWDLSPSELEKLEGIGKSLTAKIGEVQRTGVLAELEDLKARTPPGILEMLGIKGLGPKKVGIIWHDLGIDTSADLYYACNENRLIELKGFGLKTQAEIKKALEFTFRSYGKFIYALAEPVALDWLQRLSSIPGMGQVVITGSMRRKNEVIEEIEFVLEENFAGATEAFLRADETLEWNTVQLFTERPVSARLQAMVGYLEFREAGGIPVRIYQTSKANFTQTWFLTTGTAAHLEGLKPELISEEGTEKELYALQGLPFIEPELREGIFELEVARNGTLKPLLDYNDLRGAVHNHSTYSDGVHSLREMAEACIALGLEYLVISDHSKSAFYARGLTEDRIILQHAEIDALNKKLYPFRIFKGIESDILSDGSLDYSDEVLAGFEVIIASIHSNLRMDKEKATTRLLNAIANPFTTILGHPTGRLLLGREGYPIDHKRVIDACAAHHVVIEINANPNRLDIDWRWIPYALEKGVMISINPDAHRKEGLIDMQYGVHMARKGGLSRESTLNALSLKDFSVWLEQLKLRKKLTK